MLKNKQHFTCAVIGNWHLAFVTAASLIKLGHSTILISATTEDEWGDQCPALDIQEEGVNETLEKAFHNASFATSNYQSKNWSADYVWLAIDTKVNDDDTSDLTSLHKLLQFDLSSQVINTLVVTSQVPLGFCQLYKKQYNIAYVPENLRLGHGMETFLNADRLVIGAEDESTRNSVRQLLKDVNAAILLCDLNTAEMIKHATNTFLANSISLANQLALIGEAYDVDNQLVGQALKLDARIGKKAYVMPGTGFAGGTLPRDLRTLQKLALEKSISSTMIDAILKMNDSPSESILHYLKKVFGTEQEKNILIMGYSYKKEVDSFRRSPAIDLAKKIHQESNHNLYGYDPIMNNKDLAPLADNINHLNSLDQVDFPIHACLIMTARNCFKSIDWNHLIGTSPEKIFVFDLDSSFTELKNDYPQINYKALWQPEKVGLKNE